MVRSQTSIRTRRDRRTAGSLPLVLALVGVVGFAALIAVSITPPERSVYDDSLPNPMGGSARTAPGAMTGEISFGGLDVKGAEVAMGDVALDVTYVPAWEVTNPTDDEIRFAVGMPQVVEGCCPGPIYVDGELTQIGQPFTVQPGGSVLVQFPLQMHRGMDGPHHLTLPLEAGGEREVVHVTGNFTPDAPATGSSA